MQNISQNKKIMATNSLKWRKIMNLKNLVLKIVLFYYFDDLIKIGDFDFDNIFY